jgi:hypothetical protein
MANRTVFGLAAVMGLLSFLISHYDQYFFLLHFMETLVYFVILLLMFYRLEEWAYAIGMAAPLFWVMTAYLGGFLGENLAQFAIGMLGGNSPVSFIGGVMVFVAIGLLAASAHAFWKGIWGTPNALRILLIGFGAVAVFYASLAFAVMRMASSPIG